MNVSDFINDFLRNHLKPDNSEVLTFNLLKDLVNIRKLGLPLNCALWSLLRLILETNIEGRILKQKVDFVKKSRV
jgi:hypothetical protein